MQVVQRGETFRFHADNLAEGEAEEKRGRHSVGAGGHFG